MSSLGEMSFGSQPARFASESDLPAQSPISDNAANASGERYSVEMNSLIQMIKETILQTLREWDYKFYQKQKPGRLLGEKRALEILAEFK